MKNSTIQPSTSESQEIHPSLRLSSACSGSAIFAALGLLSASASAADTNYQFRAELSLRETFDSNVYIQDTQPDPAAGPAAAAAELRIVEPKQESFVTTILPRFSLNYKPGAAFNLLAAYSPEITYYHAEPSEDYTAHRGTLNLGGRLKQTTWELLNTAAYIDGNEIGPTFGKPGDIPAIGGIPLRDRREAFLFRNGFKLTYPLGDFFIRPVASTYFHDFKTEQRLNAVAAPFTYENYIDRQDINGGLDLGYRVTEKTALVVGYRYGRQDQFTGPNSASSAFTDSPYDSSYQRILIGLEGMPWDWLKISALAGPDLRDFSNGTPGGFDDNEMLYWVEASVSLLPTPKDTITLANRRYEQPAFSSQSVYEDVTYDVTWSHKCTDRLTGNIGFRLYLGDWQAPVSREDWIYSPSASLSYALNKNLTGDLSYSYDWVESQVANKDGREFTRHLVAATVKYSF